MSKPEGSGLFFGHAAAHGASGGDEPVRLSQLAFDAVEVTAARGGAARARKALKTRGRFELPPVGLWLRAGELSLFGVGPESWLVLAPPAQPGAHAERMTRLFGAEASVCETGHGLVFIGVGGSRASAALARICRLDLHPDVFGEGACARTIMAQVPVMLWRGETSQSYALAVPLSFAQSFAHSLITAARTFGWVVDQSGDV